MVEFLFDINIKIENIHKLSYVNHGKGDEISNFSCKTRFSNCKEFLLAEEAEADFYDRVRENHVSESGNLKSSLDHLFVPPDNNGEEGSDDSDEKE